MALTKKQQLFVEEYLKDLNATQAAIRAGYSAKTALQQGPRLLGNVGVQSAVQEAMKARSDRTEITQDRVLQELARLAFFDARKMFNGDGSPKAIHELDDDTAAAISGLDVVNVGNSEIGIGQVLKYKTADKGAALANAMRHLGMFNDKLDVNVTNTLAERLARAKKRREE
jgi:phage terminase small subunit